MKRGRSTGTPTAAQAARFEAIREIGCLACRQANRRWTAAEIHHLTVGGRHGQKRRGHDYTIGLCGWHHRSERPFHVTPGQMRHWYGPSYALEPRQFRETFGQDDALLAEQEQLLAEAGFKSEDEAA